MMRWSDASEYAQLHMEQNNMPTTDRGSLIGIIIIIALLIIGGIYFFMNRTSYPVDTNQEVGQTTTDNDITQGIVTDSTSESTEDAGISSDDISKLSADSSGDAVVQAAQ